MKSVEHVSVIHPPLDARLFYKECKNLKKYDIQSINNPYYKYYIIDRFNIMPLL